MSRSIMAVMAGVLAPLLLLAASSLEAADVPGITRAVERATVASEVRGARVAAIHVSLGTAVAAGELLLELDHRVQTLDAERRKLIWEDQATLRAARLREKLLLGRVDANQRVFDKVGGVSREKLDDAILEYSLAVEERERLQIAEDRERLEYELAAAEVERYRIKAPIDGIVTRFHRRLGESVDLNDPLLELVNVDRVVLVAQVEEQVGRQLSTGQRVPLSLQAGRGTVETEGRVSYLSPVVDPASGLMEVQVEFDNAGRQVRPGGAGFIRLTD